MLRLLGERGVLLTPNGRLGRAVERIAAVNRDPATLHTMDDAEAALLLEANRDVYDAFIATYALIERPREPPSMSLEKFLCFEEGADLPAHDGNPGARNTQFELLSGAHLILGGGEITPVEPDYSLEYGGARVGVAVKRLTSINPNTLNTRLRGAADQLAGTYGTGFVVLNLDGWLTNLDFDKAEEVGRQFETDLLEAYKPLARVGGRRPAVLGFIILGTWLSWHKDGGHRSLVWKGPFQVIGLADSDEAKGRLDSYFEGFSRTWQASMTAAGALLAPAT